MKVTKEYMEWYAVLSLVYCYEKKLHMFFDCKEEEPDWQSEKLDIGLEVTEALEPEEGRKRSVINRHFGKNQEGDIVKQQIEKSYPEYSDQIGVVDGKAYFFESYDTPSKINQTLDTIKSKTKKLNDHYKIFSNNWLYIFTPHLFLDSDILQIQFDYLEYATQFPVKFDKIFFNLQSELIVLNSGGIEKHISISENLLMKIKAEAQLRAGHKSNE